MDMEELSVPAGCAGIPSLQHAMCSEHHLNLLLVPGGCLAALPEACLAAGPSLATAVTTPDPDLGVPRAALVEPQEQPRRGLWAAEQQTCTHGLNLDINTSHGQQDKPVVFPLLSIFWGSLEQASHVLQRVHV